MNSRSKRRSAAISIRAIPHAGYLGFVHRLDRPTSGVILWAKTEKAARRLSTQFQKRLALKEYWAIVECDSVDSNTAADARRDLGCQ